MCNLYSITTNQAAIIALFRAINHQVGNLPPMPGAGSAKQWRGARTGHDAVGHAATAEVRWAARHEHP
jgi:hypothetical protein